MTGADKREGIQRWANVVVEMWEEKIKALDIWDEGDLYHSFVTHVMNNSGGDVSKIDFLFKQYGIFVDMGVGRETARGNSGDLGREKKRQEKPWYSKVFFREVLKLKEKTASEYGQQAAFFVSQGFADAFDQRFTKKETQFSRTVSSLKSVRYRDKNKARWLKNYHEYGKFQWRSRNHH